MQKLSLAAEPAEYSQVPSLRRARNTFFTTHKLKVWDLWLLRSQAYLACGMHMSMLCCKKSLVKSDRMHSEMLKG